MKKILVVSSRRIWPVTNGGALRIALAAEALSALGSVEAVSIDRDRLGAASDPRETAFALSSAAGRGRKALRSVLGGLPLQSAVLWSDGFYEEVRERVKHVDLLVVHLARTLPLLPPLPQGLPVLFELTDCLSANQRTLAGSRGMKNRLLAWDAAKMARVESAILRQKYPAVVVTPEEVARLRELLPEAEMQAPLFAIPNGYDFSTAVFNAEPVLRPSGDTRRNLVFIGDFLYEPNRLAVAWMARELLPLLPAGIGIDCIGRGDLSAYAGPRLRHLGYVDDLGACLRGYALAVCPIFHGGGMQNKAISPVLHGVPTILTPMVAKGLGYDAALGVAADAEAFAQQATAILGDQNQRAELYRLECEAFRSRFAREQIHRRYQEVARPLLGL